MTPSRPATRGLVEPIVLAFLVLAAAVLGWLHLRVLPERTAPAPLAFDLRNPLLAAEIGACIAAESEHSPEEVTCIRVVEPGVVLRPHAAPAGFESLSRSAPYLVCELLLPPTGKGCDHPAAGKDMDVYPLGGFGLPATVPALLQSIQPRWVERGGRYRFVYEVQMRRYGRFLQGPVILYVDPDQPVTGVVLRRDVVGEGGPQDVVFTPVDCPERRP